MPHGGPRQGAGAPRGPRKATIEKIEGANINEQIKAAARDLDRARQQGRPLAKDRLDELLGIALGAMTAFQRVTAEQVQADRERNPKSKLKEQKGDWAGFGNWFDRAAYAAKELAKYQSPTFKAIAVAAAPGAAIEHEPDYENVVRLGNPVAASRAYQQLMKAPRQLALPPAKRTG